MPSCEKCYSSPTTVYRFYYGSRRSGSGHVKYRDTVQGSMTVSLCDRCVRKHRFVSFGKAVMETAGGALLFWLGNKVAQWTGLIVDGKFNGENLLALLPVILLVVGVGFFLVGLVSLPILIASKTTIGAKLAHQVHAKELLAKGYDVHWTSLPK